MKNIILILVLVSSQINGQDTDFPYPSFSPKGNIAQTVGNTLIEVEPILKSKKIHDPFICNLFGNFKLLFTQYF